MALKPLPSQEVLRQLLRYEQETGKLFWLPRICDPTKVNDRANHFNSRNAGKEAFTASDRQGYLHGKILGTKYQAHRVIWKIVHGVDPDVIDHVNRVTSDNRIENLRNCSVAENSRNYPKINNSSQYRGVSWVKRDSAWSASISDGKGGKISLGHHQDEESAARAYDDAAKRQHGEFATLNFHEEG